MPRPADVRFIRRSRGRVIMSPAISKTIPLSKGRFAVVDGGDYAFLVQWKWCYCNGYAARALPREKGKPRRLVQMHRILLHPPAPFEVDHANGNTLDNRRCNLRICSRSQNNINRKKRTGTSSRYKGVHLHKASGRWIATAKNKYIGCFKTEKEAAEAYNEAIMRISPDFARVNVL